MEPKKIIFYLYITIVSSQYIKCPQPTQDRCLIVDSSNSNSPQYCTGYQCPPCWVWTDSQWFCSNPFQNYCPPDSVYILSPPAKCQNDNPYNPDPYNPDPYNPNPYNPNPNKDPYYPDPNNSGDDNDWDNPGYPDYNPYSKYPKYNPYSRYPEYNPYPNYNSKNRYPDPNIQNPGSSGNSGGNNINIVNTVNR